MTRCALVGAVDFNEKHFLAQRFDLVIAVDRGYETLRSIGREPDLVVGDFDSLGYAPEGENVLRFPSEKDESDMELAVRGAAEGGCEAVLFYGCLSRRLDHTIANLQLMVGCARRGIHVAGIGDDFAIVALDGAGRNELSFEAFDPAPLDAGEYGRFISAFAYGGEAHGVTESGLKYSLADARVPDDVSLGLSNEFTGASARIAITQGNLLVTFPLGAWGAII